jgi:hypothetical protein
MRILMIWLLASLFMAKSSYSNSQGNCVDVWVDSDGMVNVANTRQEGDPNRPIVKYTEDEWLAFTQGCHNHEFEYRNLERR